MESDPKLVEVMARALCLVANVNPDETIIIGMAGSSPLVARWETRVAKAEALLTAITPTLQAREAAAERRGMERAAGIVLARGAELGAHAVDVKRTVAAIRAANEEASDVAAD